MTSTTQETLQRARERGLGIKRQNKRQNDRVEKLKKARELLIKQMERYEYEC